MVTTETNVKVPRRKAVRNPVTDEIILRHLRNGLTFDAACAKAGTSRAALFQWRRRDPVFDRLIAIARADGVLHVARVRAGQVAVAPKRKGTAQ